MAAAAEPPLCWTVWNVLTSRLPLPPTATDLPESELAEMSLKDKLELALPPDAPEEFPKRMYPPFPP